jgi:predicted O-methyltransferase YrrM
MKLQRLSLDRFHQILGPCDTSRAIHLFTKPLDTNVILSLLAYTKPRRILEIGTALGHMTANLTEWTCASAVVFIDGNC